MKKQIVLAGFGYQGMRTVNAVNVPGVDYYKILIDNEKKSLERFSKADLNIFVPFTYEESWSPTYEVKQMLSEEKNKKFFLEQFSSASLVIFVAGLGGTMAEVAREFICFLQRECPSVPIYFLATVPFRDESDYRCNMLANKMLRFLEEQDNLGYTIMNNQVLYSWCAGDFKAAYKQSFLFLQNIIENVLRLFLPGKYNSGVDVSDFEPLLHSLVYVGAYTTNINMKSSAMYNPLLPYEIDADTQEIIVAIESSCDIHIPEFLKEINLIKSNFSEDVKIAYRFSQGGESEYSYKVIFAVKGKEGERKRIPLREIRIM